MSRNASIINIIKEPLWTKLNKDKYLAYILIMPLCVVLIGLIGYPLLYALWLSLQTKVAGGEAIFIGFSNFLNLFGNSVFWVIFKNTIIFTTSAVTCKLILGSVLALLLNQKFVARDLTRALLLLPWAVPTIVSVLIWKWILDDMGLLNSFLLNSGIVKLPVLWLASKKWAMFSVILVNTWRGIPFFAITLLAGLQSIPVELYEAAEVDGAGDWIKFKSITIPSIKSVVIIASLMSTIWTFNEFTLIFLLTAGGPSNTTQILPTFSYITAIGGQNLGMGAAISMVGLPLLGALIFLLLKELNK